MFILKDNMEQLNNQIESNQVVAKDGRYFDKKTEILPIDEPNGLRDVSTSKSYFTLFQPYKCSKIVNLGTTLQVI